MNCISAFQEGKHCPLGGIPEAVAYFCLDDGVGGCE